MENKETSGRNCCDSAALASRAPCWPHPWDSSRDWQVPSLQDRPHSTSGEITEPSRATKKAPEVNHTPSSLPGSVSP